MLLYFFELVLGLRKEPTAEEQLSTEVDEIIDSGDPNWLAKVTQLMNEEGFDNFNASDDLIASIPEE